MTKKIDITDLAERFSWPKDEQSSRILGYVVSKALEMLDVRKIVLYGSRARQGNTQLSDFDIAIDAGGEGDHWNKYILDVEENLETLLKVDIVELNSIPEYLHNRITSEGVSLYER